MNANRGEPPVPGRRCLGRSTGSSCGTVFNAKAPRRKGATLGGRAVSGNAAGIMCGPEGKARAEALRRREMTPKSVAAAVDPSPLDAPIGIGIGIEPASSARFMRSPYPLVRDCRSVERRRRRPPLHGLHGETRLPGRDPFPVCLPRRSTLGLAPPSPPLRLRGKPRLPGRVRGSAHPPETPRSQRAPLRVSASLRETNR